MSQKFMELQVRFAYYVDKIRVLGPAWTIRWLTRRLAAEMMWVLLLPITVVAHLAGYRRVSIFVERIGHLASELNCFLKERALGRLPERRWFVVAPRGEVANSCLLGYWKRHVTIVEDPWICTVLSAMGRHGLMQFDISHYTPSSADKAAANYYSVLATWGSRPPLLVLDAEHRERGWDELQRMGIPRDAWFIAIHAREPGFSAQDESAHAHRNSDIRRLIPAIQEIGRRSGWVIRMGDPSMQSLSPLEGVVDYAHHPSRCDWMDVFLCAEARFFVGNSSGLFFLATAFGKPCALANMIPSSHLAFAPADVSILKLIWSVRENRYLTFNEIFNQPVADYRYADLFTKDGLRVDENTEEELYGLVVEMLDRIDGCYSGTSDDDALQHWFFSLFRPAHFGYGATGRVGSAFLRRHRDLLSPGTTSGPHMVATRQ